MRKTETGLTTGSYRETNTQKQFTAWEWNYQLILDYWIYKSPNEEKFNFMIISRGFFFQLSRINLGTQENNIHVLSFKNILHLHYLSSLIFLVIICPKMRDKISLPLKKKENWKKCQIHLFESGVKHCGVKTNTVLSISYVQKKMVSPYWYIAMSTYHSQQILVQT